MEWSSISKHLKGDPSDLIEVYFIGMSTASWRSLFDWISERIIALDCQYGRLDVDELDLDDFLDGAMSYIAYVNGEDGFRLSLSIIDEKELLVDEEVGEINQEDEFHRFLGSISVISSVVRCEKYVICEEFKRDYPFIVNGSLV